MGRIENDFSAQRNFCGAVAAGNELMCELFVLLCAAVLLSLILPLCIPSDASAALR